MSSNYCDLHWDHDQCGGFNTGEANEINVLMSERRIINRLVFGRDVVGGWRDSVVAGTKGQG